MEMALTVTVVERGEVGVKFGGCSPPHLMWGM